MNWLLKISRPTIVRFDIESFNGKRQMTTCALLSAILVSQPGCQKQPTLIPLRGQVIYQEKPLEYGSVMFQPTSGGSVARGEIQQDGTFVLTTNREGDGILPGKSRVRITAFEAQRQRPDAESEMEVPLGKSAVPDKFHSFGTSGITIEVSGDMKQPVIIDLDKLPS